MALPTNGQLNWGTPLNSQISSDEAAAAALALSVSNHESNTPSDPHGDRAYAAGLVAPITTGTNAANGYVVLDGGGHLPTGLLPPGGALANWYDVKNSAYGAIGNGTVDDSTAINAALAAATSAGGGVVWVPDGTYGIGSPLVIGSGVTLMLSMGATIQRISPVSAPTVMLQNYSAGVAAATGFIAVRGGKWDAVGSTVQSSTNTMFSFANAGAVYIQDVVMNQVPNGASPYGAFYGCSNVSVQNLTLTGGAPTNTRASTLQPCFRIEQCISANIPGLVSGDYVAAAMCNGVNILNCSLSATTSSDGTGTFTGWYAMAATTGTVNSNSLYHTNITVNICDATAFANSGISALNWNEVCYTNNIFNNPGPGNLFNQNWVSTAPALIEWVVDDNDQPNSIVSTGSLTTASASLQTVCSAQVLKNFTYLVRAWALYNGSSTSQHATFAITGPTATSAQLSSSVQAPQGGGVTGGGEGYGGTQNAPNYTLLGHFVVQVNGFVQVSANGSIALQMATSGGTLTVVGGTLELIPVFT